MTNGRFFIPGITGRARSLVVDDPTSQPSQSERFSKQKQLSRKTSWSQQSSSSTRSFGARKNSVEREFFIPGITAPARCLDDTESVAASVSTTQTAPARTMSTGPSHRLSQPCRLPAPPPRRKVSSSRHLRKKSSKLVSEKKTKKENAGEAGSKGVGEDKRKKKLKKKSSLPTPKTEKEERRRLRRKSSRASSKRRVKGQD